MNKKEVFVIVSADNIAYELYVNGPYYSYEAAQDALKTNTGSPVLSTRIIPIRS